MSKKCSMPFAVIAVTLLLLGSAYGIVVTQTDKNSENTENISMELDTIGKAVQNVEHFVEKGLGEIIFTLSTASSEGTLNERADKYNDRARQWMDFQFPLNDSGVRVTLVSFETELDTETMKLSSGVESTEEALADSYIPTYLVGSGNFTAKYVCDSGSSTVTTEFKTDASCALPLVAEQGSLFKNAMSGSGSLISQMMNYQLTALAQYRVINGYGAMSEYGDMGTVNILTEADVGKAYTNAVKILGLIDFRIAPEGIPSDSQHIDLADEFVAKDGYIEIDLSAVYAQALMSLLDDACLKWFDYFYGNKIMNAVDTLNDTMNNAWDSMKGFFTGKNLFSAAPYIEAALESGGLNVSEYRYMYSGKEFSVTISGSSLYEALGKIIGSENFDDLTLSVPYPDVDLMGWDGISDFKKHYRSDENEIRNWFVDIINSAAVHIGQNKSFGTLKFKVDSCDEQIFMNSVSETVKSALAGGDAIFETVIGSAISEQKLTDPFYGAIHKEISDNYRSIYGVDTFENGIRSHLIAELSSELSSTHGDILDSDIVPGIVDDIIKSHRISDILSGYSKDVSDKLVGFDGLGDILQGNGGIIKNICRGLFESGLAFSTENADLSFRIIGLCQEIEHNMSINAYYGLTDIPGLDRFNILDNNGNTTVEKLRMSFESSPEITIGMPNDNLNECVHYVGFQDITGASFCSVFSVSVRDDIRYTVSSGGTLDSIMGSSNSSYTDTVQIEVDLKIQVASGWSLQGVKDYKASTTVAQDAWNLLMKILGPLLDPLRKILSMLMDVLMALNSALMEVAKYVSGIVERIYNALIEPLEQIRGYVEGIIDGWISNVLEGLVDSINYIVGINASKQTVGFSLMGFQLLLTTKLASLANNTKTLLTISMGFDFDKLHLEGSLTFKQKGSGLSKQVFVTGGATISGNDWKIDMDIDPTMKTTKYLLNLKGLVKGVEFDIVIPELVQFKEIEYSLCDIPGLGTVLSNIPLPIPGLKASLDAGVDLKFNIPFETGILINEFESNPEGTDTDREWVELFNSTSSTVDLNGYTISAGSGLKTKVYTIDGLELRPGAREVIYLPGSFLNNSGSNSLKGGEYVILKDSEGTQVDKTPTKSDTGNDKYTWQRVADGSSDWAFMDGTPDDKNGGGMISGEFVKVQIGKIVKDCAVDTLKDLGGSLDSTTELSEYFTVVMQNVIDSAIELVSQCLVEGSIFVSLDITDAASTACVGFRASLSVDSEFVEQGLKCIVGEIEDLVTNLGNPYGIDPVDVIYNNTYLGLQIHAGMHTPKFLDRDGGIPNIQIALNVKTNLSALSHIIGGDRGTWKVVAGLQIIDCPTALIPSALNPDRTLESDLWLVKATFRSAN